MYGALPANIRRGDAQEILRDLEQVNDEVVQQDINDQDIEDLEIGINFGLLSERWDEHNILYRLKATDDFATFRDANHFKDVTPSLILDNYNKALEVDDYHYKSNGMFHFFFRFGGEVFDHCVVKFSIVNLRGFLFGTANINLQGLDHTFYRENIRRGVYAASSVLMTGGLAGCSAARLNSVFEGFRLIFLSTKGGGLGLEERRAGHGVLYYKWSVGWFPMKYLIDDEYSENDTFEDLQHRRNSLVAHLEKEIERQLERDEQFGVSGDQSDIPGYESEAKIAKDAGKEEYLQFRKNVFQQRIDAVSIKLIPAGKIGYPLEKRAIHFSMRVVEDADEMFVEDQPEVNFEGNAPFKKLSNLYRAKKHTLRILDPTMTHYAEGMESENFNPEQEPTQGMKDAVTALDAWQGFVVDSAEVPTFKTGRMATHELELMMESEQDVTLGPPIKPGPDRVTRDENLTPEEQADIFFVKPDGVGCLIADEDLLESSLRRLNQLYMPPLDENNNCFFQCVMHAMQPDMHGSVEIQRQIEQMRTELMTGTGKKDGLVTPVIAQMLANKFGDFYHVHKIQCLKPHKNVGPDEPYACQGFYQKYVISLICLVLFSRHTFKGTPFYYQFEGQHIQKQPRHLDFIWHKKHSYLVLAVDNVLDKVKCSRCAQWIKSSNFLRTHTKTCTFCHTCKHAFQKKWDKEEKVYVSRHKCPPNRLSMMEKIAKAKLQTVILPKVCEDWISTDPVFPLKRLNTESRAFFYDIEAFPDKSGGDAFTPYAIQYMGVKDEEPHRFYGPDCMKDFLKATQKCRGNLWSWNGSRFDNFLLLRGLLQNRYEIPVDSMLKNAGAILAFKLHPKLKVLDLCQFIKSSLKKACKDFNVPAEFAKKDFDHRKVFDFQSAEEHRAEVEEYLKYDVISLKYLFVKFQKEMFQCFQQDINQCVSLSQFGYKAWALTCPVYDQLYIPHPGKEEDDDRAAYYGGRVTCQRKEFQSNDFREDATEYDYDKIQDYLVKADVNSLYPHVQRHYQYAYGKWHYWCAVELEDLNVNLLPQFNLATKEDWFLRSSFCVDVTCPRDLITPFLMERRDGLLRHTLEDKKKTWYWGCELMEALVLGYRVTHVYEVKEFEKLGDLFKDFVMKCWQGRLENPKPSSKNLNYKLVANSTTGKFAQKTHLTNTNIFNCRQNGKQTAAQEEEFAELLGRLADFDTVFDFEGENCALILETYVENAHAAYPVYLSGQILAYSRVYMSMVYRTCNSYLDPDRAIYYTDTDSLVMPSACVADLVAMDLVGKGLGQLGCDLYDDFMGNKFAKIVRCIYSAPKGKILLFRITLWSQLRRLVLDDTFCSIPLCHILILFRPLCRSVHLAE